MSKCQRKDNQPLDNVSTSPLVLDPPPSALVPGMKQCARCTAQKPLPDFNYRQSSKDERQSYCRPCQHDDHLLRAYNLTWQERDLMFAQQQGQCAVCQRAHPQLYIYAFEGIGVLNLLCPRCMRVLNGFNRNPAIVEAAIDYLDYFASRALRGVQLCYKSATKRTGKSATLGNRKARRVALVPMQAIDPLDAASMRKHTSIGHYRPSTRALSVGKPVPRDTTSPSIT